MTDSISRRIERRLPPVLLDSPLSAIGFLYATVVGMVWGFLWSTGPVERRGRLWVFRGMPAWAFPRGGVCMGACYLTGTLPVDAGIVRHESIHAAQWRRFGFLMPLLYALEGRDALRNRFEVHAGLADGRYVPRRRR
ncbi:Fe-S oxidoreductase [Microbacterium xanthum]|uniref:Fe-S oxidoreductase n=1 Tax=Microbacterium xanthum TaxID=3079794 RepID=UPI002AD36CA3|nr:Fe-S oxidoreductase [Microbacterium sp. KSW-48]MDZ8171143.1 Fe-S oxidoreductase [Microbacterium sp. KSW-48]